MPPLPTLAVLPTFSITNIPPASPVQATPRPAAILPTQPTISLTQPADSSEPTETPLPSEPDRIWLEQRLGDTRLVVWFFTDLDQKCVRFTISTKPGKAFEQCPTSARDVIVGVQGIVTDSSGMAYTVIAGRVFSGKVTAVSLELDQGENAPAPIDESGFIAILPGKRTAIRAIPIDQYGNLAGPKYVFR